MKKYIINIFKIIFYLILFILFLCLITNFFNIVIFFREIFINFFILKNIDYFYIIMLNLKFFYFNKILLNNFLSLFEDFFLGLIQFVYLMVFKILIFLKYFFYKILYFKHIFEIKTVFKAKGYSEFFLAFFFKPNIYRFFSFYVFFIAFFISLDWIEHAFESIDNTDSEFEIDFESSFTWDNDPLIGKNFFSIGQRLAMEKTSEGPDFYKINEFFYQSKKSKFNKYNREFLGGPEYFNLLDFFSTHEGFHQVGSYEFFGPSFAVIFVSFETDFEIEFFFFQKFFFYIKQFFNNITFISVFESIFNLILYFICYLYLLFKYLYFFIKNFRK